MSTKIDSKNFSKTQTSQLDHRVSQVQQNKTKSKGKQNLQPVLHEVVDRKHAERKNFPQAVISHDKKSFSAQNISKLKNEFTDYIASVGEYIVSFSKTKAAPDNSNEMTAITLISFPNFFMSFKDCKYIIDLDDVATVAKPKCNTMPFPLHTHFGDTMHMDISYGTVMLFFDDYVSNIGFIYNYDYFIFILEYKSFFQNIKHLKYQMHENS